MIKNTRYSKSVVKIGQQFGSLKVLELVRHKVWRASCDGTCDGNIIDVWESDLLKKRKRSCGCDKKEGSKNHFWSGMGELSGKYYGQIIRGAKKRKIKFDIDMVYLWELFQKQEGKCALSGLVIDLPSGKKNISANKASLDRIDSNLGYVKGNLQWVNRDLNHMKMDYSQEYFIRMCKAVSENWDVDVYGTCLLKK